MADDALQALFGIENLAAWCIVPYDGARRGPVERAELLAELGFRHFVWDGRPENLAGFEAELDALAVQGITLDGVWLPVSLGSTGLDDAGLFVRDELTRRGVSTDLWVCTEFGEPGPVPELTPSEQQERVEAHARALVPAAEAARAVGGRVGLYNHLGWFGEPRNQLAVLDRLAELGFEDAGLVYNQHHGHAHVEDLAGFASMLELVAPRLLALNLNGMVPDGDRTGQKILPLGHGRLDERLLGTIARVLGEQGWRGRVGLIGHTADDARDRLLDNLEGLAWLVDRLRGDAPGLAPVPRIPAPVLPGW